MPSHYHFLSAGLVAALAAVMLANPFSVILEWILVGGLISVLIDIDVFLLFLLRSKTDERFRVFRNPINIYKNNNSFIELGFKTGVMPTAMITHFIFSAIIMLLSYYFYSDYVLPIAIGVILQLIGDISVMRRAFSSKFY